MTVCEFEEDLKSNKKVNWIFNSVFGFVFFLYLIALDGCFVYISYMGVITSDILVTKMKKISINITETKMITKLIYILKLKRFGETI